MGEGFVVFSWEPALLMQCQLATPGVTDHGDVVENPLPQPRGAGGLVSTGAGFLCTEWVATRGHCHQASTYRVPDFVSDISDTAILKAREEIMFGRWRRVDRRNER